MIERNTVYERSRYGEVLVLGIHRVYRKYDSETDEGEFDAVFVRICDDWDADGQMFQHGLTTPKGDFVESTGDVLRVEKFD